MADVGAVESRVRVRPGLSADAGPVSRILSEIIASGRYSLLDRGCNERQERAYLKGLPRRSAFLVAEDGADGRVVGCQVLEPLQPGNRTFDLVATTGIWVDLARRREGIGTRLALATLAAARELGYGKIFTDARADNSASLAFHVGLGYRIVGTARRHVRVQGRDVDVVFIEKLLDEER